MAFDELLSEHHKTSSIFWEETAVKGKWRTQMSYVYEALLIRIFLEHHTAMDSHFASFKHFLELYGVNIFLYYKSVEATE